MSYQEIMEVKSLLREAKDLIDEIKIVHEQMKFELTRYYNPTLAHMDRESPAHDKAYYGK